MKRRKKTRTKKAEQAISQALRRLEKSEGRVARQNARKALTQAVRRLKAATDTEYPTIRKKPRPGPTKLAPGHKRNRLKRDGFRQVDVSVAPILRAAGVAVHEDPAGDRDPWTRAWAVDLHKRARDLRISMGPMWVPLLRRGVRSKTARREAEVILYGRYAYKGPYASSADRLDANRNHKKLTRLARSNPEFRNAVIAAGRAAHDADDLRGVLDSLLSLEVTA